MENSLTQVQTGPVLMNTLDRVVDLEKLVHELREWLPIQNPLPTFIHNNPLMNWEKWSFHEASQRAALLYGSKSESLRLHAFWERDYAVYSLRFLQDTGILLINSYLDQGVAMWTNPFIEDGLWHYFLEGLKVRPKIFSDWKDEIIIRKPEIFQMSPLQVIEKELKAIELNHDLWKDYLLKLLFGLKGWSGLINKLETEIEQAPLEHSKVKLVDWLAILVVCEHSLNCYLSRIYKVDLHKAYQKIFNSYSPEKEFSHGHLNIEMINQLESDEKISQEKIISGLKNFWKNDLSQGKNNFSQGKYHLVFCMDDREEPLRRHVEEIFPEVKTYSVPGFFYVDMWFLGFRKPRPIAQCPPIMRPSKFVTEITRQNHSESFLESKIGMHLLNRYFLSRTLLRGFLFSIVHGLISFILLFLKIFSPAKFFQLENKLQEIVNPTKITDLVLDGPGGYTLEEMASMVSKLLDNLENPKELKGWIVLVGHGSTTSNNPFQQAYGCGACGGNPGHPNARAMAKMANREDVRKILRGKGYSLQVDTIFIPGFHDTCADELTFWPTENLSSSQRKELDQVFHALREAAKKTAYERCQHFDTFSKKDDPEACVEHVRNRARDITQPRPEYGHTGIAYCLIGRRKLSRGFNLNRNAFLVTYDYQIETDGSILEQAILGTLPVAVNISLDYFFSKIDSENFGAGSKLPLNASGLLGVMTGSKSDLRIGLAHQMIEKHTPVRLTCLVEAKEEHLLKVCNGNPRLKRLLENEWFFLGRIDPETREILFWRKGNQWITK